MEAQQKQVPHRAAWTALSTGFGLVSCAAALGMATHLADPDKAGPLGIVSGLIGLAFWSQSRWGWCP